MVISSPLTLSTTERRSVVNFYTYRMAKIFRCRQRHLTEILFMPQSRASLTFSDALDSFSNALRIIVAKVFSIESNLSTAMSWTILDTRPNLDRPKEIQNTLAMKFFQHWLVRHNFAKMHDANAWSAQKSPRASYKRSALPYPEPKIRAGLSPKFRLGAGKREAELKPEFISMIVKSINSKVKSITKRHH